MAPSWTWHSVSLSFFILFIANAVNSQSPGKTGILLPPLPLHLPAVVLPLHECLSVSMSQCLSVSMSQCLSFVFPQILVLQAKTARTLLLPTAVPGLPAPTIARNTCPVIQELFVGRDLANSIVMEDSLASPRGSIVTLGTAISRA